MKSKNLAPITIGVFVVITTILIVMNVSLTNQLKATQAKVKDQSTVIAKQKEAAKATSFELEQWKTLGLNNRKADIATYGWDMP